MRITSIAIGILLFMSFAYLVIPLPYIEGSDISDTEYKVSFNSPFKIHFSQSMNKASVENNFAIHPKLDGELIWSDMSTLEYYPDEKLTIGDSYRIIIGGEAKCILGKKMGTDIALNFKVTGSPYVQFVSPNSEGDSVPIVDKNQVITVMFDRAMEWENINRNSLLEITPDVKGDIRILGSSTFQFIPKEWPLSTEFELKVPYKITARDGGETESIFVWNIKTATPKVVSISPGNENVGINSPIILKFNQDVELEDIKPGTNALLYPSNDIDADINPQEDGFFNTEVTYGTDENNDLDKSILVFTPTFPYLYETEYRFVLNSGLMPKSGELGMREDFEFTFTTSTNPSIKKITTPTDDNSNIAIEFNTEMKEEDIMENISLLPNATGEPVITLSEENTKAEIYYNLTSNTEYTFTVSENIKDAFGNTLGKKEEVQFTTSSASSFLKWSNDESFPVFMKGVDPEISINHSNIDMVYIEACQVTERNFFKYSSNQTWDEYRCYDEPIPVKVNDNESLLNLTGITQREWESGIYHVSIVTDNNIRINKTFFVTDTTFVIKKSSGSILVWATDLITGEPVSRMELFIYNFNGEEIGRGVTDGDGVYKISRELGEGLYVVGKKNLEGEDRWGLSSEYWPISMDSSLGYSGHDFGDKVYVITNKINFLPGEEIDIKGIIRNDYDHLLKLPDTKKVNIIIKEDLDSAIFGETVVLRRNGSFDLKFNLPNDIKPGNYTIEISKENGNIISSNNRNIYVIDNEANVDIEWGNKKEVFYANDIKLVNLKASYGTSIPAASLRGDWKLYKKPYYFNIDKGVDYYSFSNISNILCSKGACGDYEEFVHQGEFRFDNDGMAEIVLTNSDGSVLEEGFEYVLITNVESVDNSSISKSYNFKVHPGNLYVGLSSKHYFYSPGDDIDFSIFAHDIEGKSIFNKSYKVSLVEIENEKETKTWESKNVDVFFEPVQEIFPIPSKTPFGEYKLKAEGADDYGNLIVSEIPVYIVNEQIISNDFELIFDQVEYFVGGKAMGYINSPSFNNQNPSSVLLTYERGNIVGYQVVDLVAGLTKFQIPIADSMSPNVLVNATLINNNNDILKILESQEKTRLQTEQMQSEVELLMLEEELEELLKIGDEDKIKKLGTEIEELKKDINSDDSELDDVTTYYKPTIQSYRTNILVNNPDNKIFIDLSMSPESPEANEEITVNIYTYDYQNRPVSSVVTLSAIEEKILQTTEESVYDFFHKPMPSSVSSSSNLTVPSDGYFASNFYIPDMDYNYFKKEVDNSAYFNPVVLTDTDEGGKGEITFTLPNEGVTWKLNAIATNEAKKFGDNNVEIAVKKRLSIKPVIPNFAVPGDEIVLGAYIQNLSNEDINTSVSLLINDNEGEGGYKKNVSLKAGETTNVEWNTLIGDYLNEENLKIVMRSSEDYVETILPLKYLRISNVFSSNGMLEEGFMTNLKVMKENILSGGGLSILVNSSTVGLIEKYINDLHDAPFESTEKNVSILVADLIIKNVGEEHFSEELTNDIDTRISNTISNINSSQLSDGGFALWRGAEFSNAWTTAYSLWALNMASDYNVPSNVIQASIQYLWNEVSSEELSQEDKLFILWALSEVGQYDTTESLANFNERESISLGSQGFLLMNIDNLVKAGQKSAFPFLEKLKGDLILEATEDESLVYFQEGITNSKNTNSRTTAVILYALSKTTQDNPLTKPILNYLVSLNTKPAEKFNTQESIWITLALAETLELNESETEVSITVNGKETNESFLPIDSINSFNNTNEITLTKDGEDDIYYSLDLEYYTLNKDVQSIESGIGIIRNFYSADDNELVTNMLRGNLYYGKLHLIIPTAMEYVVVEDNLPAGVKALSLDPKVGNEIWKLNSENEALINGTTWLNNQIWNFNDIEIENDRILLYAERLPAGVYEINYLVQAGIAGKYNHLPASIRQLFNTSVYARTGGSILEIK